MADRANPARAEDFTRLDAAFRRGDFQTLVAELGTRPGFPNVIAHEAIGPCLTYAIYHGPMSLVTSLLEAGADPNWPSDDGFPPLLAALSCVEPAPGTTVRGDVDELLELLLAHGANVSQRGVNDYTPLHEAARQGNLSAVEILLAHGAEPDAITAIDDFETALEVAQAGRHLDVVERLEPLTTRSAWEKAARNGATQELKRLLARGHDLDATDGYGMTALTRAAHSGHLETVTWLVDQGADLDRSAKHHLTALMLAVIVGHHAVARALVRAGADTSPTGTGAPGFAGKTAADLADDRGDARLATFIRSGGR